MASRTYPVAGRASLACKQCRQRKVKCSGDWPSCKTCIRRSEECQYAGTPPDLSLPSTPINEGTADLPPRNVLVKAVEVFFDLYGDFPFWFFRKHAFMEELAASSLPRSLLLCMLSLAARFVEPCYHAYGGTVEAGAHFASCARKALSYVYDDITLTNVHCNLILGLYEMGNGNEHRAWLRIGIASRICQALGLLHESSINIEGDDGIDIEAKRRTLWSCFVLERLLVNGRDRPLLIPEPQITTLLPMSRADFTIGRENSTQALSDPPNHTDSLPAMLIRVVDILSRIVGSGAAGVGGRHVDARSPWLDDMPFSRLKSELRTLDEQAPSYLSFSEANIKAHVAAGEGKIFVLMHIFYMTAGARLHRKYLPFIPPPLYDPAHGPCDGPEIIPGPDYPGFWSESTREGVRFANKITAAFCKLEEHHIDLWTTPLSGIALLASSSFHIFCVHTTWEICREFVGEPAKDLLIHDLRALIKMQESWPVAAFWIKSMRLHYEKVSLAQNLETAPSAHHRTPFAEIKEAMLQFHRSDREKEGLPAHIPSPEHDLFGLLERDPPEFSE